MFQYARVYFYLIAKLDCVLLQSHDVIVTAFGTWTILSSSRVRWWRVVAPEKKLVVEHSLLPAKHHWQMFARSL